MPSPATPDYNADGEFVSALKKVLDADLNGLVKARRAYGESWCKRGGTGAFMMLARKWDRLEHYLTTEMRDMGKEYDVLEACRIDGRPEGCIDTIRDLRRYLALVEAKLIEEGVEHDALPRDKEPAKPKDMAAVRERARRDDTLEQDSEPNTGAAIHKSLITKPGTPNGRWYCPACKVTIAENAVHKPPANAAPLIHALCGTSLPLYWMGADGSCTKQAGTTLADGSEPESARDLHGDGEGI